MMFDLADFISGKVTKRTESMFAFDMDRHYARLKEKIAGRRVLVIGGAGSIGSSFIKELLPFRPAELVVADINENGLAELTRDLRSEKGIAVPEDYVTYPMDFSSSAFYKMFRMHRGFDIVANFSAHKHVRSEKDIFSVEALLQNNVLHAKCLLELLLEYPPEEYFCVSTDKAANPVNIMGASKRIMEDVIFSYSNRFPVKTARFANVAFSNGSLPDSFLARIAKQQPISAPVDVKRYFVSPKESGQICLLACLLGNSREIFFPKLQKKQMMGFDEIAVSLLQELGYEVLQCASETEAMEQTDALKQGSNKYPVYFSKSDTSGEKESEEFYVKGEYVDWDRFKAMGVISRKPVVEQIKIDTLFEKLETAFRRTDATKEEIVEILKDYLGNFEHMEKGKSLDSKM